MAATDLQKLRFILTGKMNLGKPKSPTKGGKANLTLKNTKELKQGNYHGFSNS
jgi:hypothetical protein